MNTIDRTAVRWEVVSSVPVAGPQSGLPLPKGMMLPWTPRLAERSVQWVA